jgi:hypothetical protein
VQGSLAPGDNAEAAVALLSISELERADHQAAAHYAVRVVVELSAVVVTGGGTVQRPARGIEGDPFCLTRALPSRNEKRAVVALPAAATHCIEIRQELLVRQEISERLTVRVPAGNAVESAQGGGSAAVRMESTAMQGGRTRLKHTHDLRPVQHAPELVVGSRRELCALLPVGVRCAVQCRDLGCGQTVREPPARQLSPVPRRSGSLAGTS